MSEPDSTENETPSTGPLPGQRRRRKPMHDEQSDTAPAPPGAPIEHEQTPASDRDPLSATEKPKRPDAKVLGLRVSNAHYDTANLMINTLSMRFQMDKRQVAERMVKFLSDERMRLFDAFQRDTEATPVDLDFFNTNTRDN